MDAQKIKEAEEAFKKQQEMFELYSKTVLNALENLHRKFEQNVKKDTENKRERYERLTSVLTMSWGKVFRQLETGIELSFSKMTREVGQGGFGQWGVETGRKLGGAMGDMLAKKLGAKSPEVGRMVGQFAGGALVSALQSGEAVRMMGAKFSPMMTAGLSGRSDYGTMGGELIRQSNKIRLETGATREEILELASQLSKLGIPFDQTGEKATRYAIAAEKVLNLDRGLVQSLDETAITKYGQSWEDVASILGGVSSATEYWHTVAKQTNSTLAASLASNNNLAKMYAEVQQAMSGTSLSATGLGETLISMTNVMGQMGLRPGMMTKVTKEFMGQFAPKTGDLMGSLTQGHFIEQMLNRTDRGRKLKTVARSRAEEYGHDPLMIGLTLNRMMANDDKVTNEYYMTMVESIGDLSDSAMGTTKGEKKLQTLWRLQGTFGISWQTGDVLLTAADEYQKNLGLGKSPEEAWQSVGQSAEFKSAAAGAGLSGKSPEEIFNQVSGIGSASLSTGDKVAVAAENLASYSGQYFDKLSRDGARFFQQALKFMAPKEAAAAIRPMKGDELIPSRTASRGKEASSQQSEPSQAPQIQPPITRTLFSYPMSTSRGTEQVTTSINDKATIYKPGSEETKKLFAEAAVIAGVPTEWASSPALHSILQKESGGVVGRPNYLYGERAKDPASWGGIHEELRRGEKTSNRIQSGPNAGLKSSATGLGQLILPNVKKFYPSGVAGIGNPVEEAAGMMKYIQAAYGSPEIALSQYGKKGEGY